MHIDDLKIWLIEKITITRDLKKLNEIKDLLSKEQQQYQYSSSLGDDFPMINENDAPVSILEHKNQLTTSIQANWDQFKDDFNEGVEDISREPDMSHKEMEAYMSSLFNDRQD